MIRKIFRSRFLILFIIASGFVFYRFSFRKPPEHIELKSLPIVTLEGEKINLQAYQGKTVFLTFWATWCGDCRKEMPGLQKAIEILKEENIAFVLVSDEDSSKISGFVKQFAYSGDSFFRLTESYRKQGIKAIPTNYIISPSGKVLLLESESGRDWSSTESIQMLKSLISKP